MDGLITHLHLFAYFLDSSRAELKYQIDGAQQVLGRFLDAAKPETKEGEKPEAPAVNEQEGGSNSNSTVELPAYLHGMEERLRILEISAYNNTTRQVRVERSGYVPEFNDNESFIFSPLEVSEVP